MILAQTVYDTCLALAKKDQRGNSFSIEEYNNIAALVNMELYNFYLSKYESGMAVTDALLRLKTRNVALTLSSGQAWLPGSADRLAGNPWIAHPWGTITATATVDVVNWTDAKVKITSPDHGLKDGAVVTCTGLSTHVVTSKAIHYIDRDNFWVDVNYAAPDVLTSAAWTVVGASYKEVDLVTEEEISTRWEDHLTKPTIQNPVAVLDTGDPVIWVSTDVIIPLLDSGHSFYAYGAMPLHVGISVRDTPLNSIPPGPIPLGLETGDLITLYGGTDGAGTAKNGYDGTHIVTHVPRPTPTSTSEYMQLPNLLWAVPNAPSFAYLKVYNRKRINVYPTTIPTVNISYISFPLTPFLDWYVNDTTYTITYLSQGEILTDQAAGYTYRDGTATDGATDFTSITQDWEWDDDLLPQIVYMMLQKMGINLENISVAQISTQLNAKEESQV